MGGFHASSTALLVLDTAVGHDINGISILNVCAHQFNFRRYSTRS